MHIILGGTHGLGAELAKQLQARSRDVFVIGRSYKENDSGKGLAADLSSAEDIERVSNIIHSLNVESFFWVAGCGYTGDFADQPDVLKMGEVNFANVLPIVQEAWKKLSQIDSGKFVVVSSTSGVRARPNEAVYAATKHAQVGFTRSLGLEAERLNLPMKVSLFLPGGMQTSFWEESQRPNAFDSFLDPAKVAAEIIKDVDAQKDIFYERTIERGSL